MIRNFGVLILIIGISARVPESNYQLSPKSKSIKSINVDEYSGDDYSGDLPIIIPKTNKHLEKIYFDKKHSKNNLMGKNVSSQTLLDNGPKNKNKNNTNTNTNIALGISGGVALTMVASLLAYRKHKMKLGHKLINTYDNYNNYNTL